MEFCAPMECFWLNFLIGISSLANGLDTLPIRRPAGSVARTLRQSESDRLCSGSCHAATSTEGDRKRLSGGVLWLADCNG